MKGNLKSKSVKYRNIKIIFVVKLKTNIYIYIYITLYKTN